MRFTDRVRVSSLIWNDLEDMGMCMCMWHVHVHVRSVCVACAHLVVVVAATTAGAIEQVGPDEAWCAFRVRARVRARVRVRVRVRVLVGVVCRAPTVTRPDDGGDEVAEAQV